MLYEADSVCAVSHGVCKSWITKSDITFWNRVRFFLVSFTPVFKCAFICLCMCYGKISREGEVKKVNCLH